MNFMANRPFGITILSIFGMLKGLATLLVGILLLFGGTFLASGNQYLPMLVPSVTMGVVIGVTGIAVSAAGLIIFAIYMGLFRMSSLAMWIILLVEALSLMGGLLSLVAKDYNAVWGTIWSVIIVTYLWSKRDRFV
jgi:hypothetical protein